MPRTCRTQALLTTRRRGLRRLRAAATPSAFPVGGGLGADDAEPEPEVKFPRIGARSPAPAQENWEKARSQVAAFLGQDGPSESSEEPEVEEESPVTLEVELQRFSKLKAAVLAAQTEEELEEVKAAMKPGRWPAAAPWIRRGPTLQDQRRERKAEVDWVAEAGLKPHLLAPQEPKEPKRTPQVQASMLRRLVPLPRRDVCATSGDPSPQNNDHDETSLDEEPSPTSPTSPLHVTSLSTERRLRRELRRAQNFVQLPPSLPMLRPALPTPPVARTRMNLPPLPQRLL